MANRFKVIPYEFVGGGLLRELPGLRTKDIAKAFDVTLKPSDFGPNLKYSEERVTVRDTVTKQKYRLYTSFGEWRIGGDHPNDAIVDELEKVARGNIDTVTKDDVYITNVHRGKGARKKFIYAQVRDMVSDEVLINATLDYCLEQAYDRYNVVRKEWK